MKGVLLLQSFELQRILEGEKAQRTETARLLQETQRRAGTAAEGPVKDALSNRAADLQEKLRLQSSQVSMQYIPVGYPQFQRCLMKTCGHISTLGLL